MSLILYLQTVLHAPERKVTNRGRKKRKNMLATGDPEMKRIGLEANEKKSNMEEKVARAKRRLLAQKEKVQKMEEASSTNKENKNPKEADCNSN